MRKLIAIVLLIGSSVLIGAPSYAASVRVTGVPNSFSIGAYGTNGVQCGMIVNGLFYYYNGYNTSIITAIDVARRTKGSVDFLADDTSRNIIAAY